jgi:hypothetical protein
MLPVPSFAPKVTVSNVSVTVNVYVHVPMSPFGSASVPETVQLPAGNDAVTLMMPPEVTFRPVLDVVVAN